MDEDASQWEPVAYHDKSMKRTAADQTMQPNEGEHPAVSLARKVIVYIFIIYLFRRMRR